MTERAYLWKYRLSWHGMHFVYWVTHSLNHSLLFWVIRAYFCMHAHIMPSPHMLYDFYINISLLVPIAICNKKNLWYILNVTIHCNNILDNSLVIAIETRSISLCTYIAPGQNILLHSLWLMLRLSRPPFVCVIVFHVV